MKLKCICFVLADVREASRAESQKEEENKKLFEASRAENQEMQEGILLKRSSK